MSKQINIRPRASQDIDDHFNYIAQNNPESALKFFDATRLTIAQIARMPGIGTSFPIKSSRLQGIRKWAVKGFKKYIVFYIEFPEIVEIVRILYGSQDISSILGKEK